MARVYHCTLSAREHSILEEGEEVRVTWLEVLGLEMAQLGPDDFYEPPLEARPHDHVVGEVDLELRRLFTVAMKWGQVAEQTLLDARYEGSNRARVEELLWRASELGEKSELAKKIFWTALRDGHDLWDKPSVGIRSGWEVVYSEEGEEEPAMPVSLPVPPQLARGLLANLFGLEMPRKRGFLARLFGWK